MWGAYVQNDVHMNVLILVVKLSLSEFDHLYVSSNSTKIIARVLFQIIFSRRHYARSVPKSSQFHVENDAVFNKAENTAFTYKSTATESIQKQ